MFPAIKDILSWIWISARTLNQYGYQTDYFINNKFRAIVIINIQIEIALHFELLICPEREMKQNKNETWNRAMHACIYAVHTNRIEWTTRQKRMIARWNKTKQKRDSTTITTAKVVTNIKIPARKLNFIHSILAVKFFCMRNECEMRWRERGLKRVADRHSFYDQHLHAIIEAFLVSYLFVFVAVFTFNVLSLLFMHQCVEFSLDVFFLSLSLTHTLL